MPKRVSDSPRRRAPVAAEEQRAPDRICSTSTVTRAFPIRDTGFGHPALT